MRGGRDVPEAEALSLGNEAVELEHATVLYADISGSTSLVDTQRWNLAAEVYKAFLFCASRILTSEGLRVTAYDGDRIMGIFLGNSTPAARAALKINYATRNIVNPLLKAEYPNSPYNVRHVVGVDVSPLRATRTGARGANDLVWVGRAANYAAKLTTLDEFPSWVTGDVYRSLEPALKVWSGGKQIWARRRWTGMNDMEIYCSGWTWKV